MRILLLAACALSLVVACTQEKMTGEADGKVGREITVFEAQTIVTMDTDQPRARFVATGDGRVLAVAASIEEISNRLDGAAFTFDRQFAGKVLMPGLIDPHLHPMMAFLLPMHFITPEGWDLPSGVSAPSRSPEDYRLRLSSALAADDASAPFFTWGYHQFWHGPIDREMLDAMAPIRPVIVWHRSFHEVILNSAALKLFGFDTREDFDSAMSASGADPEHADFGKGHFFETALAAALPPMRPYILSPLRLNAGFDAMKQMMLENGVTMIADMATGLFAGFETERALIDAAFGEASGNPARVMLVPDANSVIRETGSVAAAVDYVTAQTRDENRTVFVNNRIKLFADGAFFSQYMQMGPPGYDDGHEGKWINPPEEFENYARAFWNAGVTIHWHVNGDAGLDAVLNVVEQLQAETPHDDHRLTLEHLGYSREDQNARIAALGVLVSAQPNYVYVLSDKYAERGLGYERASQISRLGSLEEKSVTLALHSDLTMAPVDPLFLAWIAATRQTMEGALMAPEERLSLDKALRAVTIDAAFVLGLEEEIGSIAAGKRADFAVLESDPYQAGASALKDIGVWGVVFEGRAYAAH